MNESGIKSTVTGTTVFALVCALVTGILIWSPAPGSVEFQGRDPDDAYYNLLVQGFRAGQLNVNRQPPAGLEKLPNPYKPAANLPYQWDLRGLAFDMSYYKGKLFLYFGVTPAVVLFWPYVAVTGHYLSHRNACVIFSIFGFLIAARVLYGIWRRYCPESSPWVAASGVLALGLGGGLIEILSSCDVWEVAVTCGFAFTMLALGAIWRALHEDERKARWVALASLAYGLAVGSRPSLLFGSIILLVPIVAAWSRGPRPASCFQHGLLFAAAIVPLMLTGLGLMLYNFLRFDSPFEFGWHYQLTGFDNSSARQFSLHYAWFDFRFYFLQPMGWTGHFPFVRSIAPPPIPPGHAGVVKVPYCGILRESPVAWLSLAAPLGWIGRPRETAGLRWFGTALLLYFASCVAILCLFVTVSNRYELDYLPAMLMLAMIGILGLERILAQSALLRTIARCVWLPALAYSLLFNILTAIGAHAVSDYFIGNFFFHHGRVDSAIEYFDKAATFEPSDAGFHYAFANALFEAGRRDQSMVQFQKALDLQPDFPEADNNLAFMLLQAGRVDEAIKYFQKASELQKNCQTFYNLAYAYRTEKMALEAESNWQKAIELQPRFLPAQMDLSWTLATWPDATARDGARALALAQNLDYRVPDDPKILRILAAAYADTGHFPEAVVAAKRALGIAQTQTRKQLIEQLQSETSLYQSNTPCRTYSN
ncbi:MAG TPA: tetratricopeptide repeat protein [Verrucomicrobiae bacterium]|nr:tetratricopeptide repeat protein [Verrucomicrobiae bacterium]